MQWHALGARKADKQSEIHPLTKFSRWQLNCPMESIDRQFARGGYVMLREIVSVPSNTLIDLLAVILASGVVLTANDVAEIEQIQGELNRRGEDQH